MILGFVLVVLVLRVGLTDGAGVGSGKYRKLISGKVEIVIA